MSSCTHRKHQSAAFVLVAALCVAAQPLTLGAQPEPAAADTAFGNFSVGIGVAADCERALAIPQGEVWCLRDKGRTLVRLDQSGAPLPDFSVKLDDARGFAALRDGVAILDRDQLRVFDNTGQSRFEAGGRGKLPGQLRAARDVYAGEHLVVADTGNRRVQVYALHGKLLLTLPRAMDKNAPAPLRRPVAVAEDRAGRLYVADDKARKLFVFAPDGTLQGALADTEPPLIAWRDLAIGPDDALYVLGHARDKIMRVRVYRGGQFLDQLGAPQGEAVLGRATDLSFTALDRATLAVFDAEARQLKVFVHHESPAGVTEVSVTSGIDELRLTWRAPSSEIARAWRVYCSASESGPYKKLRDVSTAPVTFTRAELKGLGDCRAFRVAAVSALGDEGTASATVVDRFPEALADFEAGRYAQASKTLADIARAQPANPAVWRLLGRSRAANGETDLAVVAFERLAALPGNAAEGAALAGQAWLAAGDYPRAYAAVEAATRGADADAAVLMVCGRAALALARFDAAVPCLTLATKHDVTNADAHLLLGQTRARLGELPDAVRELDAALDAAPDNARVWLQAADAFFEIRRYQEAAVRYRRAQALDANAMHAWLGELRAQLALGDDDAARAVAAKLKHGPEWARQYSAALMALHALAGGKAEDALALLLQAHAAAPEQPAPMAALVEEQLRRGDGNAARAVVVEWIKTHARDPEPHVLLGRIAAADKQFEQARTHYQRALALLPASAPAQLGIARAHFAQRRLIEAQTAAQEAIRLDRVAIESRLLAAEVSRVRGDSDGAIRHASDAASLDVRDARPHVLLGKIYLERKDYDAAVNAWEQAVALDASASNLATLAAAKAARKNAANAGGSKKNRRQ